MMYMGARSTAREEGHYDTKVARQMNKQIRTATECVSFHSSPSHHPVVCFTRNASYGREGKGLRSIARNSEMAACTFAVAGDTTDRGRRVRGSGSSTVTAGADATLSAN